MFVRGNHVLADGKADSPYYRYNDTGRGTHEMDFKKGNKSKSLTLLLHLNLSAKPLSML